MIRKEMQPLYIHVFLLEPCVPVRLAENNADDMFPLDKKTIPLNIICFKPHTYLSITVKTSVQYLRQTWLPLSPSTSPSVGLISLGGGPAAFPVLPIGVIKHILAAQLCIQAGADEEGAAHLAVQRVRLLRRRREPVFEHDWNEVVDPLGGGLRAEVEDLGGGEGLAEDHHGVDMGVRHGLDEEMFIN